MKVVENVTSRKDRQTDRQERQSESIKENFSLTACLAWLPYLFDYSNLITPAVFSDGKIHVNEKHAVSSYCLYIKIRWLFPPKTSLYECLFILQKRIPVLL